MPYILLLLGKKKALVLFSKIPKSILKKSRTKKIHSFHDVNLSQMKDNKIENGLKPDMIKTKK